MKSIQEIDRIYNLPCNTLASRIKRLYQYKTKEKAGLAISVSVIKNIKFEITEKETIKIDLSHQGTKIFFDSLVTESWKNLLKLRYYR